MEKDLMAYLKRRNQELLLLLETSKILATTLDLRRLLAEIMHQATKVVDAESSSLMLIDEAKHELVFDIALGEKGEKVKQARLKIGEGIAGWVAKTGEPLIVGDTSRDARFSRKVDELSGYETRSVICVPLKAKGRIIGVMEAINKKDADSFVENDIEIFSAFASQAAIALDNAQLFGNLKQEKEKIEAMFQGMGDGAVLLDADYNIVMLNQSACGLLNLDGEKMRGVSFNVLKKDFEFIDLGQIEKSGEDSILFDMFRPRGKKLYVSCRMTRIKDTDERTMGYIMVLRDITEEKREMMMTRDFFSLISHKLKTPLVTIVGYAPMLLEEGKTGNLNDFQKRAIKSIDDQGRHLAKLIEELLYFTSLETREFNLQRGETNLARLVRLSLEVMDGSIKKNNVEVSVAPSVNDIPPLFADDAKMIEVFKAIIDNAIKFNDKGKKRIEISAGKTEDGKARVRISDNGQGIPSEEFENIFRKFYQIEEDFTGQVEGAGLGLALAKGIVEAHGGKISVASRIGEGSTFTLVLPLKG